MILPNETINRINTEARKAAMIIEYGECNADPSNSARMQQTSRIDPIQKEFYIKGAAEWAGKAKPIVDLLQEFIDKYYGESEMNGGNDLKLIKRATIAIAKYKEVSDEKK